VGGSSGSQYNDELLVSLSACGYSDKAVLFVLKLVSIVLQARVELLQAQETVIQVVDVYC